jgi:hypothetical protein
MLLIQGNDLSQGSKIGHNINKYEGDLWKKEENGI